MSDKMLGDGLSKAASIEYVQPWPSIPRQRPNPIDPLMMYSSNATMVDMRARGYGQKLTPKQKRVLARRETQYSGARAMLYSPLGHGSAS